MPIDATRRSTPSVRAAVPPTIHGVLFDLDGVLADTAVVHEQAWKETFDELLEARAAALGTAFVPFSHLDYLRFVDGRPRLDGVTTFLSSRAIVLPTGPADAGGEPSAVAVGDAKNRRFNALVASGAAKALASAPEYVHALVAEGVRRGVVSSSGNVHSVLQAIGLADRFDVIVDAHVAKEHHLLGKPAPATFLHGARMLDMAPSAVAVIEDADVGVKAGHDGGFGLVVGVGDASRVAALTASGADLVVERVGDLIREWS